MTPDQLVTFLNDKVREIREHFTEVQILASFENDSGQTERCFCGAGNWFARLGMATEFVKKDQNDELASSLAQSIRPDSDGEEWKR